MPLSAPLSHLHPPPKVPEHTDSIERIDSTRTGRLTSRTTGIREAKIETPGHTQLHLFHHHHLLLLIFLRIARLRNRRRRRGLCTGCQWIPFSVSAAALALLGGSENDIGEDDANANVLAPFATSPTGPSPNARSSADGGERCCCCLLESGSGVTRNNGDLPRLALSLSSFVCPG